MNDSPAQVHLIQNLFHGTMQHSPSHSSWAKIATLLLNLNFVAGFVQHVEKKKVELSGISALASSSCGNCLKSLLRHFFS